MLAGVCFRTLRLLPLFLFTAASLQAADRYWTGALSNSWNTNGNWIGNSPSAGDTAVFDRAFANQPDVSGNISAGAIWVTGGLAQSFSITGAGRLQLSGNTVNGQADIGLLVDHTSPFTLTISTLLKLGGSQTWMNNSGSLVTIGNVDMNNKTLTVSGTGNITMNGVLSGDGNLVKTDSGRLLLSGTNTFTDGLTLNAGVLELGNDAALGEGALTLAGGILRAVGGARNIANAVSLAADMEIDGSNAINFSGTTTLSGASRVLTISNAASTTFSGSITDGPGTFGLTKTGAGELFLLGANSFTGFTLNDGRVGIGTATSLGDAGTVALNGGDLHNAGPGALTVARPLSIGGNFQISGARDLAFSGAVSLGGTHLFNITNTGTTTFSGVIGGAHGFTKTGNGVLTVTGHNTFSGAVTIAEGTLIAASASGSSLGNVSSVTVQAGAVLALGASDEIGDSASVILQGGRFRKGNFSEGSAAAAGMGTLSLAGADSVLDFGTGTTGVLSFAGFDPAMHILLVDNWSGTPGQPGSGSTDRLIFGSGQSLNLNRFQFNGYYGAMEFSLAGGYYEVVPMSVVPEINGAWATAGLLLLALFHARFRLRPRRIGRRI